METTFNNVSITVPADTPKEAYTLLCNALASINAEWTTDTYSTVEQFIEHTYSTTDLFGESSTMAATDNIPATPIASSPAPTGILVSNGDELCIECGYAHPAGKHVAATEI